MRLVEVRTRKRRRLQSAAISTDTGSASANDAKKFSADVSAAALVRGVTTSSRYGSSSRRLVRRRLTLKRMHLSIASLGMLPRLLGQFRQLRELARRSGRQAM